MLYPLLCYNKEDVVWSWSKEEDAAVMARLSVVHEKLVKEGKLGPSLRLLPTTAATTLHSGGLSTAPSPRPRNSCWAFM